VVGAVGVGVGLRSEMMLRALDWVVVLIWRAVRFAEWDIEVADSLRLTIEGTERDETRTGVSRSLKGDRLRWMCTVAKLRNKTPTEPCPTLLTKICNAPTLP
jgi:hypothetical protein